MLKPFHDLKSTELFQKLISKTFKFDLNFLEQESYNPFSNLNIQQELEMATEIYYALMFSKGYLSLKDRRNMVLFFRRDVLTRLVSQNGQNPDEKTLLSFRKKSQELRLAHIANTKFTAHKKKPIKLLSQNHILRELKFNKNSSIIYDNGIFVLTPKESYGKVISGFINKETIDILLRKNIISQDVYFNADGRKSYSLVSRNKSNKLPTNLIELGLPSSYLRDCGVR